MWEGQVGWNVESNNKPEDINHISLWRSDDMIDIVFHPSGLLYDIYLIVIPITGVW